MIVLGNISLNEEFVFVYVATYIFVALFCAVILSRVNTDIGRQLEVRFFRWLLISLLVYCIVESIWAVGNFGYSEAINRFNIPLSVINHILVNSFCFLWFCYMESYLHSSIVNTRKGRLLVGIPFYIIVILAISTIWNGLVFYPREDGSAGRGPLYLVTVIIPYAYAAVATARAVIAATKQENKHRRSELVTMSLFVIPPAVIGVIDTLVPTMPIVAPAFFFSFLIVFTMLQESQISTDQLTHLNNRRRADRHLDVVRTTATEGNPYLLLIIDVNSFKEINDTHGHMEGDNALCIVAAALRDSCRNSSAFIARWGGDEFIIMVPEADVNSPEDFTNLIENCLLYEAYERQLPYKLTLSIGFAYCTGPEKTRRQLLEEADAVMYEVKRRIKQSKNQTA